LNHAYLCPNLSVANLKGSGLSKCDYDFATNQPWCRTPRQLHFIDETQELVSNYKGDVDREDAASPMDWNGSSHSTPEHVTTSTFPSTVAVATPPSPGPDDFNNGEFGDSCLQNKRTTFSEQAIHSNISFNESPGQPSAVITSSTPDFQQHGSFSGSPDCLHTTADHSAIPHNITSDVVVSPATERLARIYLDTPIWPLQEKEEAILIRYFVENLSPSLDLCDPDRHFALVVPHRAAACPILLNAIFACSATQLSRVSDFDPYISDRYHQECLKHLIPMLNDHAALMDENLLAATVILRFLEEVQGKQSSMMNFHQVFFASSIIALRVEHD
jgi:hypothetical protein